jgi:N,N'-diacetyllegionaminate synthase
MALNNTGCLIVGEVAQAHDGSLGTAHAYIDAIAAAGAGAVKFQTHIASAESTPSEPWRVPFSFQDASRYDYWKRMEFTEEQWLGLKRHAEDKALQFLSSPFSIEAATMLRRIGIRAWKIASGEINNPQLMDYFIDSRLPIMLSTGMSGIDEIDAAVTPIQAAGVSLTLLQCTSIYPCPAEKIGLNLIPYYRERYGCEVGLSDHSGTIFPGLAAATIGIDVLEVHVTLTRESFGPDVASSITTQELATLVEGVRFIEKMNTHAVDKGEVAISLRPVRELFTKSIVARIDIPVDTILSAECLTAKKPGTGIPASRMPAMIGRRMRRSVGAGEFLQESDMGEHSTEQIAAGHHGFI